MTDDRLAIGNVARRTGLQADLIRAWERRYGAIEPERDRNQRRLYSEDDVTRLVLLRRLVEAGHSIGRVAELDDDELRRMLTEEQAMTYATSPPLPGPQTVTSVSVTELDDPEAIVAMCLEAVTRLDSQMLNTTLRRASVSFGRLQLLQGIVVPLMARIGQGWRAGELRPFHEHMATVVMRTFLTQLPGAYRSSPSAPALIVATPAGQYHDLGALLVAATASADDWKIVLLGASLPAEEIAGAFLQANARAIALSITFPADDPHLGDELLRLRDLIGNHVPLLVGGRASHGYTPYLESIKAHQVNDLATFETLLQTLRNSSTESLRE